MTTALTLFAFAFGLALGTWITTYWYRAQLIDLKQQADEVEQDYLRLIRMVVDPKGDQ